MIPTTPSLADQVVERIAELIELTGCKLPCPTMPKASVKRLERVAQMMRQGRLVICRRTGETLEFTSPKS